MRFWRNVVSIVFRWVVTYILRDTLKNGCWKVYKPVVLWRRYSTFLTFNFYLVSLCRGCQPMFKYFLVQRSHRVNLLPVKVSLGVPRCNCIGTIVPQGSWLLCSQMLIKQIKVIMGKQSWTIWLRMDLMRE